MQMLISAQSWRTGFYVKKEGKEKNEKRFFLHTDLFFWSKPVVLALDLISYDVSWGMWLGVNLLLGVCLNSSPKI